MTTVRDPLPHWDMTPIFPGLESPEFAQGFRATIESIGELVALFDSAGIGQRAPAPLDAEAIQTFETVIQRYNAVLEQVRTVAVYIQCFVSTNSRNDVAQARMSELEQHRVRLQQLATRFTAWIGSLDVEALIARSESARAHAFALRKAWQRAAHLMSPAEEALAVELNLTGSTAWEKLYDNFTSRLTVPFERDGKVEHLPMSQIRNLAFEADRDVRRRAYEAELGAWEQAALPIAAALNSIKGETNLLAQRRAWETPLDAALFNNSLDRQTLEAMLEAARESFPDFRRYLHTKACFLGLPRLAWYDLFAPIGAQGAEWRYQDAIAFVTENFGAYSDRLRRFAERAFRENWIDAEPRAGKVGGAYCTGIRPGESRILSNYNYAFGGVTTLAHELGHAYHNLNLAQRTPLQRSTPMPLAETASIFCETIIMQAALQQADTQGQIEILEEFLQGACQVVVDITSRFLFEGNVFAARRQRELSVEEFNRLMLEAQRDTYGDGLDPEALHKFMWAAKPHYYGSAFYNYPYMFGLLFGLGLYARYQEDPEGFKASYDDLLSSTGMADAATLAGQFGIEIRTPDFWRSSLDIVRGFIDRFAALAPVQNG
ncbi:MAG TPA: M3 family oligoendopeptidase [Chthonomonadaceae bacterium]|nr:M3 family oligoendopeptidase [Chthonomonadaceae bacterium]